MTAIERNRAAVVTPGVGEAQLRGGGNARTPRGIVRRPERKVRYSADPAAELMPAAEFLGMEPDFGPAMEEFAGSPFDPRRRKVLGRLMGMFAMDYQGARHEERRFLQRLLMARNAREGYVANRALHLCGASNVVRRTLALGTAEARFDQGTPVGFIGAVQARVAATVFMLLGAASRERVWDLLTVAGRDAAGKVVPGADPVIERALILKALAARRHLLGPWSAAGPEALAQVQSFAEQIRGCWRVTLSARTTLLPGDPARQARRLAGLTGAARAAYVARGELDPVFAWQEHGVVREAKAGGAIVEDLYEELPDLDRSPLLERPRLHQALAEARLHPAGKLEPAEREAIADYLGGRELGETRLALKASGLGKLARQGFDAVRPESIEAIREDAMGIYKFDAARALGLLLSRYTGAVYVRRVFSDQMTAGADPVGQIRSALGLGLAVPITVGEPRTALLRAWAALAARVDLGEAVLDLRNPATDQQATVLDKQLVAPQLPAEFGKRVRADAYLAPAALDLLAPPFGIPFPELGIEDAL